MWLYLKLKIVSFYKRVIKLIKLIKSTLFILLFILTGCNVVPGGHVETDLSLRKESYGFDSQVNVRLISPGLFNKFELAEPVPTVNLKLEEELDGYRYLIGKGDILNITVLDHPELTTPAGQFRSPGEAGNVVHSDGTIFYPHIGHVLVIDKSVGEVRGLITELLSKYIESPQIDVSVAAFRSQRVFVSGSVNSPSVLPITNVPLTLLDALNVSGGIRDDADWRSVVLTSETDQGSVEEVLDLYALYQKGDLSQNRLLNHNDIIHIPRNDALNIFVMGDVVKPSTQRIGRSNMTLAEALNNAGGIGEKTANASGIFVLRESKEDDVLVDVFQLDASKSSMLILSTQFILKPLDIVYVTSSPIARWNRVINQLIPSFSALSHSGQAQSDFTE